MPFLDRVSSEGARLRAARPRGSYAAAAPLIRSMTTIRLCISGGDLTRLLDDVQPFGVLLRATVQGVLVLRLDHSGDLARLAQLVVVDLADRHQLRRRADEERLLGQVQLRAGHVALLDRVAEVL